MVLDKSVRIFQIITNATEATYDNVLQFNGTLDDIIGSYSCNVSNNKSTQDSVHTIQGKIEQVIIIPFLPAYVPTLLYYHFRPTDLRP